MHGFPLADLLNTEGKGEAAVAYVLSARVSKYGRL